MDRHRLSELIAHWRVLAEEARQQGDNPAQAGIFRAHAFGVSDGLEVAAKDLADILEALLHEIDDADEA